MYTRGFQGRRTLYIAYFYSVTFYEASARIKLYDCETIIIFIVSVTTVIPQ